MANFRQLRIVLAGIIVLLVIVVLAFLSRSGFNLSSSSSSDVNVTVLATDLIVQTLFAQTAIAEANAVAIAQAEAEVNIIIQNVPTATPTPPVFPQDAYSALLSWARDYASVDRTRNMYNLDFVVVSSQFATNLRGDFLGSAGGLQEAWCVVTVPPVIILNQPQGIGDRDDDTIDHFILNRYGVRWEVRDLVFESTFQQMGCRNW